MFRRERDARRTAKAVRTHDETMDALGRAAGTTRAGGTNRYRAEWHTDKYAGQQVRGGAKVTKIEKKEGK